MTLYEERFVGEKEWRLQWPVYPDNSKTRSVEVREFNYARSLEEARAEARREALEEASKVAQRRAANWQRLINRAEGGVCVWKLREECSDIATEIRALAADHAGKEG